MITTENLIQRGFYLSTSLEDTGIEEYRLEIADTLITYFYAVASPPLGLRDVYIHHPDGTTEGFKNPITELSQLDEIINNLK